MKILHLIQRYPPAIGGSEQWAAILAREQARLGHEVEVLTLALLDEDEYWHPLSARSRVLPRVRQEDGVLVRRYPPARFNPLNLRFALPDKGDSRPFAAGTRHDAQAHPDRSSGSSFKTLAAGRALPALPGAFSPWLSLLGPHSLKLYAALAGKLRETDVLHLHALPFAHNHAGRALARAFGKPAVFTPHFHPAEASHEGWPQRRLLKSCDALFAVTEFEKHALVERGIPEEKITVTGNTVADLRTLEAPVAADVRERLLSRLGLSPETPYAICLGRKSPQKGIGLLLEAAPLIQRDFPQGRLVLAGPSSEWFGRIFQNLPGDLRSFVVDAGQVSEEEKAALLQSAKVLLSPSAHEAYGIVFLEAWAAGIPAVGAGAGAITEVMGEGGLLFASGDARGLAAQAVRLLGDGDLRARLALAGRAQIASRPTAAQIAAKVDGTYQRVLARRGRA